MAEPKSKQTLDWTTIATGLSIFLCACALAVIAISLRPVAQWAEYQSTCIQQESKKAPISWAVRKCNGRSKVYQVKESSKT